MGQSWPGHVTGARACKGEAPPKEDPSKLSIVQGLPFSASDGGERGARAMVARRDAPKLVRGELRALIPTEVATKLPKRGRTRRDYAVHNKTTCRASQSAPKRYARPEFWWTTASTYALSGESMQYMTGKFRRAHLA